MANDRRSASDDYKNEPVMGYSERQLGVLGRPLPKAPDHFATIMTMLSVLPKIVPQAGPNMARAVAAQGRGGDTAIAHLTPGEMVIPKRLQTPEVMAALKRAAGGSLARLQVGHPANRLNPRTGAPEFDDDDDDDDSVSPSPDGFGGLRDLADQGLGDAAQGLAAEGYGSIASPNAPVPVNPDQMQEITINASPQRWGANPQQVNQFFNRLYEPLSKLADDMNVPRSTVLGLAAYEGGWGSKNNLFGLKDTRGQTRVFDSPEDSIAAFRKSQWPARLQGLQNLPDLFTEMQKQPVYNTGTGEEAGYYDKLRDTIDSVRGRLPQWQKPNG
jgi:hypothetical protein